MRRLQTQYCAQHTVRHLQGVSWNHYAAHKTGNQKLFFTETRRGSLHFFKAGH